VNAWVYLQGAFPNIYKDNKMLITGLSLGNLNTDYSGGASIRAVYVEAPVPECSTMLMMAGGLFLIFICVKMATSA
jgi:hypothetical protein